MPKRKKTETDHITDARQKLVNAALDHVAFDGWSQATFDAAIQDTALDPTLVAAACPRGALDLAVAFHKQGDAEMTAALTAAADTDMRYSDRIAYGVKSRLLAAAPHREAVRRGAAFFALPQNATEGASLVWGTADAIWNTLGDTSRDVNWYTKRTTLSAVYSATLLFWLGDESKDFSDTWEFLDRRIADVMQFEKAKASLRENPLVKSFMAGPGRLLGHIKAPANTPQSDLPGYTQPK